MTLAPEPPDTADARALMARLDDELHARYPAQSVHGVTEVQLADPRSLFVVARDGDVAVGCGALRPLADGVGEVKRMFVEVAHRGRGVGRAILAALEDEARAHGFTTLRLETGTRQPEALALYASAGWVRIPCFGEYAGDAFSVCFEKRLDARVSP